MNIKGFKGIKGLKQAVLIPVALCFVLAAVYSIVFIFMDDRKRPEITMDSDVLSVSVHAGRKAMLKGVTATDNKDGDVTASILVEGISKLTDENTAVITYVAYDASGNAAKASRTVQFTDYQPPVFGQEEALVFASNTAPDVLEFMTAEDILDGDISNRIKGTLLSDTTSLNYPGVHTVEFRVTNSMGDTQYITLPVEVYQASDFNAKAELTDYLVYIKTGEDFNPRSYLENVVVGNTKYSLDPEINDELRLYFNNYVSPAINPQVDIVNIEINSDVDTDVPGVYSVSYVIDYVGRYEACTRLNVVVEE